MTSKKILDSIVISDGLSALHKPSRAVSEDGRFIFTVGNFRTVMSFDWEDGRFRQTDSITSFDLDIIDVLLSVRMRVSRCDTLHDYGLTVGIYALDERHVVLVEQSGDNREDCRIRQWLLTIDRQAATVVCDFYRVHNGLFVSDTSNIIIGKGIIIITDGCDFGVRLPNYPLSAEAGLDFSERIREASTRGHQALLRLGRVTGQQIDPYLAPFVITSSVLGFLYSDRPTDNDWYFCLDCVIVMNIVSGGLYITDTECAHPMPQWECNVDEFSCAQRREAEVVFNVIYDDKLCFVHSLNTRTMTWTEIKDFPVLTDFWMLATADGNAVLTIDKVTTPGSSRVIGGRGEVRGIDQDNVVELERVQFFRTPLSVPSLARLALYAVQKSETMEKSMVEHIYKCIH